MRDRLLRGKLLAADVCMVFLGYGGLNRAQFGSDTLFRMLMPESDIGGAIDHGRYGTYLLATALLRCGVQITDHYRFFYLMFMLSIVACLYMLQRIFLPIFEERLRSGAAQVYYACATGVGLVNVLFIENFMFPEYQINYACAYTLAIGGAWCLTRRRWGWGGILSVLGCIFYQTALIPVAMLVGAFFVMDADFMLSKGLFFKTFLTDMALMLIGFLDNMSGYVLVMFHVISPQQFGKRISPVSARLISWILGESRDLLKSSLGLMPGIWAPGLMLMFFWGLVLIYLLDPRRRMKRGATLLLFLTDIVFVLLLPFLSGEGGFFPRVVWVFYLFLLTGMFVAWKLRSGEQREASPGEASRLLVMDAAAVGFLLLQLLSCQNISINRYISNTLDLTYARAVLSRIEAYGAQTGIPVTKLATEIDTVCLRGYDEVHYRRDQINERTMSVVPYSLLEYVNGPGIQMEKVSMDETVWEEHFQGRNWDRFDPEEQLYFKGDTLYWVIF